MNIKTVHQSVTSLSRPERWVLCVMVGYLILMAVSHLIRWYQPDPWVAPPNLESMNLPANPFSPDSQQKLVLRYLDTHPHAPPELPVVLLIHGSPVAASSAFTELAEILGTKARVLAPDLPGFGYSTRKIENYGFTVHAAYLQRFLNRMNIRQVHIVAYSMGGGAAIHMANEIRERIVSLSLVSSLGVQELELLGNYHLNHALHGLQLAAIWTLQEFTPHMGLLDRFALNTQYARNFFDADQRPLRQKLRSITQPTLILHGDSDYFVPLTAAQEHSRLLPHSTLKILPGGHLLIFRQTAKIANILSDHVQSADTGQGRSRTQADVSRVISAQVPYGQIRMPQLSGHHLFIISVLIALATLVSEDLACIGAGLMAAGGTIGFIPATCAAFVGIVVGDLMLYAAGRFIGRPAISRAPLRWIINPDDVTRATHWLEQKGPGIIFASRFLPGSRLPVYFTAGVLGSGIGTFFIYFCIAAALWTPGLVGISMLTGEAVLSSYTAFQQYAVWIALAIALTMWTGLRYGLPLLSFKGRRMAISRYKRIRHWEFWPIWLFYIPVVGYILYLGLRYRHWTLFTAANPAIAAGGVVGESKSDILDRLSDCGRIPSFILTHHDAPIDKQIRDVLSFMADRRFGFPVICKPDTGERGQGVESVATIKELRNYLKTARSHTIVQQYVHGREFGVFYYRYPGHEKGRIFSITDKRLLSVTGDGQSTLEELILKDSRAVCMAPLHLDVHRHRLDDIPAAGMKEKLVSVGTHCRGAIFLDGNRFITPALTHSIDQASRHFKGFYFGRYDIRTTDLEAFKAGRGYKILELNGVTSEATHIYDPSNTLRRAWKTLMHQWRIAFEIGKANHQNGAKALSVIHFLKLVFKKT